MVKSESGNLISKLVFDTTAENVLYTTAEREIVMKSEGIHFFFMIPDLVSRTTATRS